MTMTNKQTRIMVIGAGYAGMLATIRLAGKTRDLNIAITLVNASDVFVERVRMHQWAANQELPARPIAEMLRGTEVKFVQGYVNAIDPVQHEIVVQQGTETQRLGYDYLMYALGSIFNAEAVTGVRDYAYTLTPNGALSASALREKLPALNERGGRMVVVGGGATGIEAAAEFVDAYPNLDITLITRGETGVFLNRKIADYMQKSLIQRGVKLQNHTTITEVKADALVTTGGETIPYDVCLWAGGFTTPSLARESGLKVNENGQILIDPYMRSLSHPDIYALGDASHPLEEPGVRMRMSAFTAVVTGAHAADCLSRVLHGKAPKPLSFAYVGQGIALGRRDAIGFNNYPSDKPNAPYFTGKVGFEIREFFVRILSALPNAERKIPGIFLWIGKGRYAAAKRRAQQQKRIGQSA
jgi:NADH dehydrogenase